MSLATHVSLAWEVDGRQNIGTGKLLNRTRRLRLCWLDQYNDETSVYFILIAPTKPRVSHTGAVEAVNPQFLARTPAKVPEKQALMKSWIDLCVNRHGAICKETHSAKDDYFKLVSSTFFGVVDVVDMQLKSLPFVKDEPERYVALSYVWGKRSPGKARYVTTRSNIMIRIQHGGLTKSWDRLPKTIQDAILLVGRLGERYVWIDSLCIVQDSMTSWEHNAKAMHLVYGNAYLTICAADGDALTGLRAISSTLRRVENEAARPNSYPSTFNESGELIGRSYNTGDELQPGLVTGEVLPGIKLLASRPPEAVIQDSQWNQRGWTFQERLLSRRCLIFAEGKVYFQCRSSVTSEDIFSHGGSKGWSLDWKNSPLRTLRELRRRAFWFYIKCVSLYTGRLLSKPKDILTAFQGTSWLLQRHLNAPLLWGLPSSHFDLALLWSPVGLLKRRERKSAHQSSSDPCTNEDSGKCRHMVEEDGFGDQEFPSWSWCGWFEGGCEYRSDMLDGIFLNISEWLRTHTWILWYIRDYEGNLRPLWDKDVLKADSSEKAQWRGYCGRGGTRSSSPFSRGQQQRVNRGESNSSHAQRSTMRPKRSSLRKHGVSHATTTPYYASAYGYPPPAHQFNGTDYPPPYSYQREEGMRIPSHAPSMPLRPHSVHKTQARKETHTNKRLPDDIEGPRNKSKAPTSIDEKGWSRQSNTPYLKKLQPEYYEVGDESDGDTRPYAQFFETGSGVAAPSRAQDEPSTAKHPTSAYRYTPTSSRAPTYNAPPYDPQSMPYDTPHYPAPNYYPTYPYYYYTPAYYSTSGYYPTNINYPTFHYDRPAEKPKKGQRAKVRLQEPVSDPEKTSSGSESSMPLEKSDSGRGSINESIRPSSPDTEDQSIRTSQSYDRLRGQEAQPTNTVTDSYGRPRRPNVGDRTHFRSIIPENPFGIIRGPYPNNPQEPLKAMPVLQFWTWRTESIVKPRSSDPVSTAGNSLSYYDILDRLEDWCGSIALPSDFIANPAGQVFNFIAISDAKSFTKDECPLWNYYVPKEREDSEWDLYYVLMLRRNRERALWERVALGKIFQAAFTDAKWYEVKLG
ncbi:MAG: hypothetical protein Q9227_002505 [Pyrenula ochraceoflavens]